MEINQRVEAEKRLAEKAFEDDLFKKDLLLNPREVLQKEFGASLPDEIEVSVLEVTPEKTYIVIPQAPPADVDLPEQSDESIQGGGAIILKAWKDADFKRELLAAPKAALKNAFSIELPAELAIEAVEETPQRLYLILPLKHQSDDELSDEQLESVAGGECVVTTITTVGIVACGLGIGACIFGEGIAIGGLVTLGRRVGW